MPFASELEDWLITEEAAVGLSACPMSGTSFISGPEYCNKQNMSEAEHNGSAGRKHAYLGEEIPEFLILYVVCVRNLGKRLLVVIARLDRSGSDPFVRQISGNPANTTASDATLTRPTT